MVKASGLRAGLGVLGCGVVLAACAHSVPADLSVDPAIAYEGPPIEAGTVDGQHALSVVAPSGGWEVRGDRVLRYFQDNRIFLTIVRPDPAEMQTQALMQFDVTPGVPMDEPLAVYARVVDFGADPNETFFAFAMAVAPEHR